MTVESTIVDDDEGFSPETPEETNAFGEKLKNIEDRCKAAGIEFQEEIDADRNPYAAFFLKSGRSKRRINIFNESRADQLLSVDFENYGFISGYEAIRHHENGTIEAGLRTTRMAPQFVIRRLLGIGFSSDTDLGTIVLAPDPTAPNRPTLELGYPSEQFSILSGARGSRYSLTLRNVRASQHDQALAELRSYSDSLFFQIDSLVGSTFILERERQRQRLPLPRRKKGVELSYPISRYNEEAMSLYMYANSARDMPLLQFLAFYQSIEFYFPRYSQFEARRRVGTILKSPTFRTHRDDDIDRLISAIQGTKANGLGSERSQLRAVVNECLSADDVRQFLTETSERAEHFSGKASGYHKIPLVNKALDIRNDVADRIYDIRCKIVHTKNEHSEDDTLKMILPFSDDAESLLNDIDLVQFIARSVLVAGSSELV